MTTKILAFDPSGNFKEGKGTTGFCFMFNVTPQELGEIKSTDYDCAEAYWAAHLSLLNEYSLDEVVIEGYRLYNHKGMAASAQANSDLETPQLIGAIKTYCYTHGIPLAVQYAKDVKSRWSESVLVKKGILEQKGNHYYFEGKQTSTHKRDALKHAMHYYRYGRNK